MVPHVLVLYCMPWLPLMRCGIISANSGKSVRLCFELMLMLLPRLLLLLTPLPCYNKTAAS
jgi:hypothetical protein